MSIRIVQADLTLPEHREAVLAMVDAYSRDTMGSAKPLAPDVRARLIPGLQRQPTTLIFLAFEGEQPVGVAVCFVGFSTFAANRSSTYTTAWCYLHFAEMASGGGYWRPLKAKPVNSVAA